MCDGFNGLLVIGGVRRSEEKVPIMGIFDGLENQAEEFAVREGEQFVERRLGDNQDDRGQEQDPQQYDQGSGNGDQSYQSSNDYREGEQQTENYGSGEQSQGYPQGQSSYGQGDYQPGGEASELSEENYNGGQQDGYSGSDQEQQYQEHQGDDDSYGQGQDSGNGDQSYQDNPGGSYTEPDYSNPGFPQEQ